MAFLIRRTREIALPEATDKVIKAEDFWAYQHASDILEEGMRKHEERVRTGDLAYVQAQERGYEAGLEAARTEHSRRMMTTVNQTIAYLRGVEAQLCEVVMIAMRRIISDFSDKDKVLAIVKNALAEVRNQKQIMLKVNPEIVPQLEDELVRIQVLYPMVAHIEILPVPEVAMDSCVVETEIGVVQASITGQLRALHQSLSHVFGAENLGGTHHAEHDPH